MPTYCLTSLCMWSAPTFFQLSKLLCIYTIIFNRTTTIYIGVYFITEYQLPQICVAVKISNTEITSDN